MLDRAVRLSLRSGSQTGCRRGHRRPKTRSEAGKSRTRGRRRGRRKLVVEILQQRRHGVVVELREVVENVLRFVLGPQAAYSQLARLPQEQDRLAEPADKPPLLPRCRISSKGSHQMGYVEQLRENRATARGLGRVRCEHGTELEAREGRSYPRSVDPVLGDPLEGVAEKGLLRSPSLAELRHAMDLLSDIRKLEVGGKGAREKKGRSRRDAGQPFGEPTTSHLLSVDRLELGRTSDLADEVQEILTFDTGKLLAEQGGDEPDVPPQCRVALLGRDGVVGGYGIAHIAAGRERFTLALLHGRIVPTAAIRFALGSRPLWANRCGSVLPPGWQYQSVTGTSATATTVAEVMRSSSLGSMENTARGVPAAAQTSGG